MSVDSVLSVNVMILSYLVYINWWKTTTKPLKEDLARLGCFKKALATTV